MSATERLALVDMADLGLSIAAQCRLLKVARSTLYYRALPVSTDDLAVMRRMDELHWRIRSMGRADGRRRCSGTAGW